MYGKEFIILTNIWLFAFCFVHGNLHYSKRKLWTLDRHKRTINQKCSGNIIVKKKRLESCVQFHSTKMFSVVWKYSRNTLETFWK